MKILFILGVTLLLIAGCGGGGGDTPANKSLFSLWHRADTNAPLDLTGGSFGAPFPITFFFVGGGQCQCNIIFVGDQASGIDSISACFHVASTGTGDPGCAALNSSGNYTISNNTLTGCDSVTHACSTYK